MNDKDKEAFEKWWKNNSVWLKTNLTAHLHHSQEAWQAACEYKQKEIDELISVLDLKKETLVELQAENKKLREAIKYALEWSGDTNAWNRLNDALKEVDEE